MQDNNNEKRASRASQTREKEAKKKVWTPPSSLDAPPAPTGFKHRWIRVESMGFQDTKNVAGRIRSGYELVRACLLYTSPSPRDGLLSRMPSSA